MLKHFILLEWKSFFRSASFSTNLALKILMFFFALMSALFFTALGIGLFYVIKKKGNDDPLTIINQFLIYYLFADLITRYFLQKNPVLQIKPLMSLPISKKAMVHYTLGKTAFSFFNIMHAFFFLPLSLVLIKEGYAPLSVCLWHLGIVALIYSNNFLNILINKKDLYFYTFVVAILLLAASQYYGYFDITRYTTLFFQGLYLHAYVVILPVLLLIGLYWFSLSFFKKNLYLDAGLDKAIKTGKTEQFLWLNQFGSLGTFLKNDLRLILRNKRSKTAVLTSALFLFYGLLFFTGAIESYKSPVWKIFAGIFVSGGFLFSFGQYVPSWDSSYYPLMMSQNIRYRDYLNSKWWLMVIATIIATLLASFYLYFGLNAYLAIVTGAVYNIGVNAHIVLWGGAYIKTPIDLASSKNAFGDKQTFNAKTLLLTLPKLTLPLVIYAIGHYAFNARVGYAFVAGAGIIGFAFRNRVFGIIETVYKKEKYKTLSAYKQKN